MPQSRSRDRQAAVAPAAAEHAPAPSHANPGPAGNAAVSRILENVAGMPLSERLFHSACHCGHTVGEEALHSIVSGLEVAVPIWIVSHAFGLGEIIDAVGLILAANDTVTAVEELIRYFTTARDARIAEDLVKAGEHLGRAIALVGTGFLIGKVAKLAGHGAHGGGEAHGSAHAAEGHAPAAPAQSVVHHESPHLKPHVRQVITQLKDRGVLVEHAERAHKIGPAQDLGSDPNANEQKHPGPAAHHA